MDTPTQVLTTIIILLAFVVTVNAMQFVRRRIDLFPLRPMSAYHLLPTFVGKSIESGQPIHLSFGSATIGDNQTLLSLAGAEFFFHIIQESAMGDAMPIITAASPSLVPLGQDVLRRAYNQRGLVNVWRSSAMRWYPSGSRSLAYAAAISAMMSDDRVSSNVLFGSFGAELALIADSAYRLRTPFIAASDQLDGIAIAYGMADQTLIGEELFVVGSYFSTRANQIALAVSMDVLRWTLIGFLLLLMIVSLRVN